jgi:hypothetical protein
MLISESRGLGARLLVPEREYTSASTAITVGDLVVCNV